jgi:hypothetical protein
MFATDANDKKTRLTLKMQKSGAFSQKERRLFILKHKKKPLKYFAEILVNAFGKSILLHTCYFFQHKFLKEKKVKKKIRFPREPVHLKCASAFAGLVN